MSVTITDRDNGWRAMLERAHELAKKGPLVKVGILDDAPKDVAPGSSPSAYTLVEVAAVHEFGSEHVPQRSFLRATIDSKGAELKRLLNVVATNAFQGKTTLKQGLGQVGAKAAAWVQRAIAQGVPPPLAESTIARKGSSKPLIDTGQLRSAITHRVEGP